MLSRGVPLLLVPLALALFPSEARPQDDFDAYGERFAGTWQLAIPVERAERIRDRAAERAANAMNIFIRSIASSRLREGSHVNRRIRLTFREGRRIQVRFDESHYESEVGDTVRVRRNDGTPMRLTQRFRDGNKLEQVFQTDGGTRWFVYEATGEGTMRLVSTTNSDRMPQPMNFGLEYRRE